MRRPPIACRRAAPSLASAAPQHIWIDDDLLSRTLDRFFRRGCPHQRRYGSHVPGPLEARRRAAKRRMTAQAHVSPAGGVPPPFSFGALFGFRSSPQPCWRYEPPSIPKPPMPLSQSFQAQNPMPALPPYTLLPDPNETTSKSTPLELLFPEASPELPKIEIKDEVTSAQRTLGITTPSAPSASSVKTRKSPLRIGKRKRIRDRNPTEQQENERHAQVEISAGKVTDLEAPLKRLKLKIRTADTLPDSRRFDFLNRAIQSCSPVGSHAGDFTLLVLQQLRQTQLSPNTIISCLTAPNVALPDPTTPKGLELVRQLNDMAKNSSKVIRRMDRMYKDMVAMVPGNPKRSISVRDVGLRMLYRAIWENALRSRSQDQAFEGSTMNTLLDLGHKFSNPQMHIYLIRILHDRRLTIDQFDLLIRSSSGRHRRTTVGAPVLDCIPRTLLSACLASFPRYLFEEVKDRNHSQKFRLLENWLRMLRVLDVRVSTAPENIHLSTLAFKSLAAYGIPPTAIGRYLISLQPYDLVSALLNWLPHQKAVCGVPPKQIEDFVRSYRFSLEKDVESHVSRNEMLARLLARMQQQALPNHEMANLIIQIFCQHKGIRMVLDVLRRLQRKGVGLSGTEFLREFLGKALEPIRESPWISTSVRGQNDAFTLHAYQSIRALKPDVLDTNRKVDRILTSLQSRWHFQYIINSAREAHVLPLLYRKMPLDLLMGSRTELIHQIAYQYSLDRTRTSQENWRSTYYLYKYLRDNKLPIGPLFTRAVMRMCIIQPLSEKRFVSARRLTWVCRIIAPVEGVNVAKRIEHIFYIWRGDLIMHAKRTLHASGGTGRAHVNTMKRLGLI
ncbi:hypothetical protein K505DRAFT_45329 [Melanomma pulvis-pyrius CBS 109.77]|uniref:Uncharacterized protein n=1 Tax=Melanomma pulvis-pyrius CBS 109.77 TaxID=1314802 RepID=A0A6A6X9N5_9PLEO|nr:hypothetical protein K505DRAFT_45329 [Melanomma pulvis-pyrius CBS 109.77]